MSNICKRRIDIKRIFQIKRCAVLCFIVLLTTTSNAQQTTVETYMDAYIVVVDTSQNYKRLQQKMFLLSEKLQIKIDTMGRSYDTTKNLICLPENDEDEMYAGEYYPRRYPSQTLSLEYLNYYTKEKNIRERTIALVALITDQKEKAIAKRIQIQKYAPQVFVFNNKIYMGCMH